MHLHWVATVSNKPTFWVQQLECFGEHLQAGLFGITKHNTGTNGLLCENETRF